MQNVIQNLRSHVFWGSHRKLFEIREVERAPVVDQFDLLDILSLWIELHQDILGFQVGVDNPVLSKKEESLADLDDDLPEL